MNNIRIQPCYYIQYITTKYSYAEIPSSYSVPSLMGNKKTVNFSSMWRLWTTYTAKQESPRYNHEHFTLSCTVYFGNCPDFHILRKAKRLIYSKLYVLLYLFFYSFCIFLLSFIINQHLYLLSSI